MNLRRMYAILLEELYLTRHSLEVVIDIFYFAITDVIIFGFISVFLSGQSNTKSAAYMLIGIILWQIIRVTQYTLTVGSLWEIWSKNLSNLFVTPLNLKEFLASEMLTGAIKSIVTFFLVSFIAQGVFHFSIFQLGALNLILFIGNLIFFAWAFGIFVLSFIFRFGTRIQAFAWSLIFLFQPLSAMFFPLEILPQPMQMIARVIPTTYVFEAARQALTSPVINWNYAATAFLLNIVYFILAILFFNFMFNKSKEVGQFARNES
jgi:ABC-2 type transport system permease protein